MGKKRGSVEESSQIKRKDGEDGMEAFVGTREGDGRTGTVWSLSSDPCRDRRGGFLDRQGFKEAPPTGEAEREQGKRG